ncbi:MAG: hypothetical protein ACJAVK_001483 [Akkermansiaceae bacterium]|jgi:hypothetical protein
MKVSLLLLLTAMSGFAQNRLAEADATRFVDLALSGLNREFPNKPGHVLRSAEDARTPSEMTPVFFGHFDWHSSVHGHWTLVRLLRLFPKATWSANVRAELAKKFTLEGLQKEADHHKENPSFERMYGWAWALRMGMELRAMDEEQGRQWAAAYRPVEEAIVTNAKAYLPKLEWPIRCGFHPESSFALGQMLDWARATDDGRFEALLIQKAKGFYLKDTSYPVRYEPSGNDFFSPGLNEADLMRRILPAQEYRAWLEKFFPRFDLGNLTTPVTVSDFEDGHLVHLVGLNLNRAWNLRGIASALEGDPKSQLLSLAEAHEKAGLRDAISGHYEGDHWLGTFVVYLLTGAGEPTKK